MQFLIDNLVVYFPFPFIYPEQYEYMKNLKQTFDQKGISTLEIPPTSRKSTALLSLYLSYKKQYPEIGKLIYCTRNIYQTQQILEELKLIIQIRKKEFHQENDILAIGVSSRRNLCVNQELFQENDAQSFENRCLNLTCLQNRKKYSQDQTTSVCSFYENFIRQENEDLFELPKGVYSIEDVRKIATQRKICSYFWTHRLISKADILVVNYRYILDPKLDSIVCDKLDQNAIIFYDDAHNIDEDCTEVTSIHLDLEILRNASKKVKEIRTKIELEDDLKEDFEKEYEFLLEGIIKKQEILKFESKQEKQMDIEENQEEKEHIKDIENTIADNFMPDPLFPGDIVEEPVPGSIRRPLHYLHNLYRVIDYLKNKCHPGKSNTGRKGLFINERIKKGEANQTSVKSIRTYQLTDELFSKIQVPIYPLRFYPKRFQLLLRTLKVNNKKLFSSIELVTNFLSLVSTYDQGFEIIIEYDQNTTRSLQLVCLDASLCFGRQLSSKFDRVILTSSHFSPLDFYAKILRFKPLISKSIPMVLMRKSIFAMIATKGNDQSSITTKFDVLQDPTAVRNYGNLLVDLAEIVPDGIICCFPSFKYMENIVHIWNQFGLLNKILEHKLIFSETEDLLSSSFVVENFKHACDIGRGGVLLCLTRGRIARNGGVENLTNHYSRCTILFGVPYADTQSVHVKDKLEYLGDFYQIKEVDYLNFDAMRNVSHFLSNIVSRKNDYGFVIFADKRFNRKDKLDLLPVWFSPFLSENFLNLSTDHCKQYSLQFFREMSVQITQVEQIGKSILSQSNLEKQKKI
ncbi:general transcription and DNA repair factor iih helicase subunit xpd [Anaeramoeba ignava]|uniref:DNA 5'-3' helicase n=1 Tax=Anaeramoeba ignava TaxID=1746090 RepID=A0A9Q0R4S1_ANAIG|nr:general transcription and DNA repair factor iih helicase subunit xpd [Anaeramoeba ignava]